MVTYMDTWQIKSVETDSNNAVQVYQSTVNLVPQTEEEKEEERRGFDRNGFNQFVSDRVPLNRAVPDTRDRRYILLLSSSYLVGHVNDWTDSGIITFM